MSRTFRNIRPRFLFRNYYIYPEKSPCGYDENFILALRRGKYTQSLLKDHISGWKEDYNGKVTRRFCKRFVAKQHRNLAKREIRIQLQEG